MSRCFPFPPPGYESRASDQIDLLLKEKHKEKKHRKEKKEKEKREGKEKKDKDRSKDKHKEKKDRKEKHKDKKKDKDKDEGRTSEERRIGERIVGQHEVKLGDRSHGAEGKDSKFTEELGRRIRDEEKCTTNSTAEHFTCSIPSRAEGMRSTTEAEKERSTSNNMATNPNGTERKRMLGFDSTVDKPIGSMQERSQGRFTAATEKERGPNKLSNFIGTDQRKNTGIKRPVDYPFPGRVEGIGIATAPERERDKNNTMVSCPIAPMQRRNDGVGYPAENLIPPISSGTDKDRDTELRRNDGMRGSVAKDTDISMEGKKPRDHAADEFKGDRRRDGDRNEKKNKGKDKDRHKEKETDKEKKREKGERKHKKEDSSKPRDQKKDMFDSPSIKPLAAQNDTAQRKDIKMMNGFLHDIDARPSKILRASMSNSPGAMNHIVARAPESKEHKINGITGPRPSVDLVSPVSTDTSESNPPHPYSKVNGFLHGSDAQPKKILRASNSSDLPLENGRASEPRQVTRLSISPGAINNTIAQGPENKEPKSNGIKESRPPVAKKDKVPPLKPPHPDSKYLSQVYSVPKMEEWPEFDDQEWLFSSDDLRPKPKAKLEDEETPQIWAEAMQIDSADVVALPYVIPF